MKPQISALLTNNLETENGTDTSVPTVEASTARPANPKVVRIDDALFRVQRALIKHGMGADRAHDLAQEAVVRFLERPRELRNPEASTRYVISIAFNRRNTEAKRKIEQFPEEFDPAAPNSFPYHVVLDVQAALKCCTRRQRRLVDLVYWSGCDISEAAARLSMTAQAAYTEISRARARMREFLSPSYSPTR